MRNYVKKEEREEFIKNGIHQVMQSVHLKRMPSRTEIELHTQSHALTNRIMKTGGFYYWANKLGLAIKSSGTQTGLEYEKQCCEFLQSKGMEAEITSIKFPYDVLVERSVKIDVKASNGYGGNFFFFAFNLEAKLPKSDFYVVYCMNERCNKTLVIPSHVLYGIRLLSIGITSQYDIYKDRWDLIERQVEFIKKMVV